MAEEPDPDVLRRLREAIETMPDNPRAVFERVRYDSRGYADIADELGIDVRAVESRLADALCHHDREMRRIG